MPGAIEALARLRSSEFDKTCTSLTVAMHLAPGGRIAGIDVERGSAIRRTELFNFHNQ